MYGMVVTELIIFLYTRRHLGWRGGGDRARKYLSRKIKTLVPLLCGTRRPPPPTTNNERHLDCSSPTLTAYPGPTLTSANKSLRNGMQTQELVVGLLGGGGRESFLPAPRPLPTPGSLDRNNYPHKCQMLHN